MTKKDRGGSRRPASKESLRIAEGRSASKESLRIADLVVDPNNRRTHNPRNVEMIVAALKDVGAARSIVIDEDDVVLAGNGVTAAAAAAGITKVRVIRSQIIWVKDRFALSRGHYHWQHEPCWYVVKGQGHWTGDRGQSTVWRINARDDSGLGHSTQKPVEAMRRPLENNSSPGHAVYDPFVGSGTTIIACEQTGRACLALDVDPAYVQVAVDRWEAFTGEKATPL
jgi:hypothetical protein